jgi:phosphopantetheinyl transferase
MFFFKKKTQPLVNNYFNLDDQEVKVRVIKNKDIIPYQKSLSVFSKNLSSFDKNYLKKTTNPIYKQQKLISRFIIVEFLSNLLKKSKNDFKDLSFQQRNYQNIYWSTTNTKELLMVAFSEKFKIGIDVEKIKTNRNILKLSERFFHEEERSLLFATSPYIVEEYFFRLWTLKEAYYKMKEWGNFFSILKKSFLMIQSEYNVWGLKWEKDFFFSVIKEKSPLPILEVKPYQSIFKK